MIRLTNWRLTAVAFFSLCQVALNQVRVSSTDAKNICRPPFQDVDGECFYFGGEAVTFQQAAERCHTLGSHLAVARNAYENRRIYQAMSRNIDIKPGKDQAWWFGGYWIGGLTLDGGKPWFWITGETVGSYRPWCAGQPNGQPIQQCIHANYKPETPGCWDDMPCAWKRYFVCQL